MRGPRPGTRPDGPASGGSAGASAGSAGEPAVEPTVQLARRRFARRQWARRWLAWRGLVAVGLVLAVLGGAVWLFLFSSTLSVQGVTVSGVSVLRPDQVREAAAVPLGEPLATTDLDAIAARVEDLAPVRAVEVTRAWPDQVRVVVTEREAAAVVPVDGGYRALDEDGVLFQDLRQRPPGLPLLQMRPGTRAEALAEGARVVRALPAALLARVEFVDVRTVDAISLELRNGDTVTWGSAEQSTSKARVLEVLLEQEAEAYDVSVPGTPTIRR